MTLLQSPVETQLRHSPLYHGPTPSGLETVPTLPTLPRSDLRPCGRGTAPTLPTLPRSDLRPSGRGTAPTLPTLPRSDPVRPGKGPEGEALWRWCGSQPDTIRLCGPLVFLAKDQQRELSGYPINLKSVNTGQRQSFRNFIQIREIKHRSFIPASGRRRLRRTKLK